MKKTALQVIDDLYQVVKASPLAATIAGEVYMEGTRPAEALTEDIVLSFLEGDVEQIQTGIVQVDIFVPDVETASGGAVCNISRCGELETVAGEWAENIEDFDGYRLLLDQMIKTIPTENNKQHFINTRLKFYYTNI